MASAQPDFQRGTTYEVRHGIGGFLGSYGLALGREVVLDRVHNEKIALPAPGGRAVQVNSPLAVTTTNVERTAHAVRSLRSATFPFAAPVVLADPLPDGIQAEVWIRSGPESVTRLGPIPLDPRLLVEPVAAEVAGPHALAAVATGSFPSFFQGQPPPGVRADEPLAKGRLGRLLVVGSGDAAANNVDFVLNSVEWLLEDPSLATIRARATGDGPMTPPPAETAWRWKIAIVAPQLLLGLALAWRVRRRRLA